MRVRDGGGPAARPGAAPAQAGSRGGTRPAGGGPGAPGGPVDVASILGIPEAELSASVRAAIDRLIAEVRDLRAELERARRRIAYLEDLADQDPLAPVLNRRAFVRELARMISFAERYAAPGSLLYFDIDGMKRINDACGHGAGDAVLQRFAEILLHNLRGSDLVGRLGGDEFGVILAQADRPAAALKAADLTRAFGARPVIWKGVPLEVGVSYGICTFAGGEDVAAALHAADQAMYAHKRRAATAAAPA